MSSYNYSFTNMKYPRFLSLERHINSHSNIIIVVPWTLMVLFAAMFGVKSLWRSFVDDVVSDRI